MKKRKSKKVKKPIKKKRRKYQSRSNDSYDPILYGSFASDGRVGENQLRI